MGEIPGETLDELAAAVSAVIPGLAGVIPPRPAAVLGRLGRAAEVSAMAAASSQGPGETLSRTPRVTLKGDAAHRTGDSAVLAALASVDALLAERLLGALEIAVGALNMTGPAALAGQVTRRRGNLGFVSVGGESEAHRAARQLDGALPGTAALVEDITRRLAVHESVAPLLAAPAPDGDERALAATHGVGYLAFAVAAVSAVLAALDVPAFAAGPPAVVGLALGAAAMLLREAEMPAGYTEAVLADVRAHFLLPRRTGGSLSLADGRGFALIEDAGWPERTDFTGNGLVSVASGGVAIRTGVATGTVDVRLEVRKDPPERVETKVWDEVVEVSWRAVRGLASVVGSGGVHVPGTNASSWRLRSQTPPWPGDYRLRVHASGRDGDRGDTERYALIVWQAPASPEIVHRAADRLGHRLRGEPEPAAVVLPEAAYRWIGRSSLGEAATVTLATGSTTEEVIRAFGGDPGRPESMTAIHDEQLADYATLIASIAVLDLGNAVVAVEHNGFRGSEGAILGGLSRQGRAASMFWNVNAVTRLSFAEGGELLASFEPGLPGSETDSPAVSDALCGIDFEDYRDKHEKGLVAVERFTGGVFTREALERITSADIAYRLPDRAERARPTAEHTGPVPPVRLSRPGNPLRLPDRG